MRYPRPRYLPTGGAGMRGPSPTIAMELDMDVMNCPVCGANAEQLAPTGDKQSINCPGCGEYDISGSVLATEQWKRLGPDERRGALETAKRSAQPDGRPMITTYMLESAAP